MENQSWLQKIASYIDYIENVKVSDLLKKASSSIQSTKGFQTIQKFNNLPDVKASKKILLFLWIGTSPLILFINYWRRRNIPQNTYSYGKAEWETPKEIPEVGIRLGLTEDERLYRYAGNRHIVTIASARSGKGTSSIIPNLLELENCSCIVIDPKGENALNTALYREKILGRNVQVLDPFNESGIGNAYFNPLNFISEKNLTASCEQLAEALIIPDPKDPFWSNTATSLLSAVIYYFYKSDKFNPSEKNLVTIYDKLLIDRDNFFEEMNKEENPPIVRHAIAEILGGDERLKSDVYTTIRSNLARFLNDEKIRDNLTYSTFSKDDLIQGKLDIYIVLPLDKLETYSRWLRLILVSFLQNLIKQNTYEEEDISLLPKIFFMDEFGNLGHLKILENAFTTSSGFGVLLWPFIQNLEQLKKDYPHSWQTILGQAGVIEAFNVGTDINTGEYISKTIGNTTIIERTSSQNSNSDGKSSSGSGWREVGVPLIKPEEVIKFYDFAKILIPQGKNPCFVGKIPYYNDPELSKRWVTSLAHAIHKNPKLNNFVKKSYPNAYSYVSEILQTIQNQRPVHYLK